jgi:hypothetical protein
LNPSCQPITSLPASAAVFATALGALVFVVSYAWTTGGAWRSTMIGRHVMTFMTVILALSVLAVVAVIWGSDWPYRNVIRTAAWGVFAACIWWRVWLLFRVQRGGRS